MKLNDLVKVSPGFHRSVSLKHDLHHAEKVKCYIPTEKSEEVIQHVLTALHDNGTDSAAMVIGSYGTGKSHLGMLIGSLLGKRVNDAFSSVLDKVTPSLRVAMEKELQVALPYLVVSVSGGVGDSLDDQLMSALRRAIDESGCSIPIHSSFSAAIKAIERWRTSFPSTYMEAEKLLAQPDQSIDYLVEDLRDANPGALQHFTRFYPELTAGSHFDPYHGTVVDIFEDVIKALPAHGFRGLLIIYDEFNRVLDSSIRDGQTLKTLQELAELASHADDEARLYMLLISHRTIGQYAESLSSGIGDEWRRVEGRFRCFNVANKPWETYDLISRVLQKSDDSFYETVAEVAPTLAVAGDHRRLATLFSGMDRHRIDELVIKGAFPLHPISTYLLPRISSRLAQNERTLFTFLSGLDGSPMTQALDMDLANASLIMPWQIYDYFEPELRRSQDETIKSIRTRITNAIDSIPSSSSSEIRLLKSLAIYQVSGSSANLPCTLEMLEYGSDHEFWSAVESLRAKRLLFIRHATGEVDVMEPADLDIEAEVSKWLDQRRAGVSPLGGMPELGLQHFVLPHAHNYKKKMTRYLTPIYADGQSIPRMIIGGKLAPSFDGCDGVICYLYPESREDLDIITKEISSCVDSRAVFALPTSAVPLSEAVWRLRALLDIRNNLASITADPRAAALLELHIEDARLALAARLSLVTAPSPNISYYWRGEVYRDRSVTSEKHLSGMVSAIMDAVYGDTPVFNNELINKNTPTVTSRRARNAAIDCLLNETTDPWTSLPSSQEIFMLDTLYDETGLHKRGQGFDLDDCAIHRAVHSVETQFLTARSSPLPFSEIIGQLVLPPFGVRRGVIPVLLSAVIMKYKHYVTIRNQAGVDQRIDASLLERITEAPDEFRLLLEAWDEAAERLTYGIADAFQSPLTGNAFFSNRFGDLAEEIFRWFSGLPRYSRESGAVSSDAKALRRCARIASRNPKQALLNDLPKLMGLTDFHIDEADGLIRRIGAAKLELESNILTLEQKVFTKLSEFFSPYGLRMSSLVSLARNFVDSMGGPPPQSLEWAGIRGFILAFNNSDDRLFARGLAQELTGARLEDWLDKTEAEFRAILAGLSESRNQVAASDDRGPRVEILFRDTTYDSDRITHHTCDLSNMAEILQSHLESEIDDFGNSVSSLEKRQVLLNMLKKHLLGLWQ